MEGLLQHQNSTASFQKNYKSCMWDWLRIFDLHNRLSVKRLLEDDVHGSRRHVRRVKIPEVHVPLSVDEHDNLDDETKLLIVNKGNQTKKSSGKALVRALIFKKTFRKHNQKQKMLPVKPRLMRTVSIHHLECSDYVLPVEMASQKSDSSESHEHDRLLPANKKHQVCGTIKHVNHVGHTELTRSTEKQANLVEKLCKTQDAFSKQMESSEELGRYVFQSNDFITTKEFINEQGESFLEIIEEPDILLENYLQDLHRSSSERSLMKSGSSPMVGLSAKRHNKSPNDHHLVNQEVKSLVQKSEPAVVDMHNAYYNSEFSPRSFHKHAKQGDHGTLLSHSKTVKKKLKDVFNENKKEHLHISMDGLLHKIPYGHTASGNVMKEKLFRSASARHFKESIEDNVSIPRKAHPHQSFGRSRSLTESSYKYSHVFESILTSESRRLQENLTSTDMDFGLQDQTAQKVFEKTHSNPEFNSFHCKEVPNEPLHGALLSEVATSNPLSGDEAIDIHTPAEPESGDSPLNVKESIEPGVILEQTLDVHASGKIYGGLELPLITSKLTETETCRVSCPLKENTGYIPLPKELSVDQQESHIELHQSEEVHEVSDSPQMGGSHVAHGHALEVDSNDESTKPSPTSVFQLNSEDYLLKPAKHEYSEDSETEPRNLHSEEVDLLAKTHNLSVFKVSDEMDPAESNFGKKQLEAFANVGKFHIQLDQKDEADFNYVRDVLRKSGFNGFEFVGAQHFPNQLVGPLLSDGHEVASYDSDDLSPEHQLLFDLIDEILLEISEKYSTGSWFSRFDPDTRTLPVEHNILDEVWRKISPHLSSQTQPSHMHEHVVARDYTKNDGWLNLRQDAVCLGVELEDLLLDGLLDELILDCDDISGYYSVFS